MARVIGHRGVSAIAPENTLAAFRACRENGVRWFEFDVGLISDGTAVVIHDDTLDRTTDATGPVAVLTGPDLATIDAGAWFGPEFAGERIPTLRQVLELMNELQLDANLEIKPGPDHSLLVATIMTELERLDPERHVIISSFDPRILQRVKRALPRWRAHEGRATLELAFLFENPMMEKAWRVLGKATGSVALHPSGKDLTAAKVATYTSAGYAVRPWTVNNVGQALELASWGVDSVFSDNPHLFPEDWRQ